MIRLTLIILSSLPLALPCLAGIDDDPLALARGGKIACIGPNNEAKTCRALVSYEFAGTQITEHDIINPTEQPGERVHVHFLVSIEDGKVCAVPSAAELDTAIYERDGKPAAAEDAGYLHSALETQMHDNFGRKECEDFSPVGTQVSVEVSWNGHPAPSEGYWLRWISPQDGYRLAN